MKAISPRRMSAAGAEPVARRVVTGLAKLGLALRAQAWRGAESAGLTPTQGQILALLQAHAPTGLRLTALARALAVTPQTASTAVAALVEKALVAKSASPEDARAIELRLTSDGQRASAAARAWPDFLLAAVDALDASEREVLLRAIVKMIRTLQERDEIPVSRICATCCFFRPFAHDDAAAPHHCAFVDAAFGDALLRLDCADHEPAAGREASRIWARFAANPKPRRSTRKTRRVK